MPAIAGMADYEDYRRKFVLTQTNAGATDITLDIEPPMGSLMEVDVLTSGPDDYGVGGRTLQVEVQGGAGDVVQRLANIAAVDNQRIHHAPGFPTGAPAAADDIARSAGGPWTVYGGDTLRVLVANAAQNETLRVFIRARCTGRPIAESVNAGVTMVETEE